MSSPILLITPDPASVVLTESLRRELNLPAVRAASRRAGLAALRRGEYSLVLLDQALLDEALAGTHSTSFDMIFQNAGTAPVLELNLAAEDPSRVVRQARAALHRRAQDQARARAAAAASLKAELRDALSSLLLESELALREAHPRYSAKLRNLVQLAGNLRNRLRA